MADCAARSPASLSLPSPHLERGIQYMPARTHSTRRLALSSPETAAHRSSHGHQWRLHRARLPHRLRRPLPSPRPYKRRRPSPPPNPHRAPLSLRSSRPPRSSAPRRRSAPPAPLPPFRAPR
jgi:hypothetical protein